MDVNRPWDRADKDREVYWSEGAGAIVMITEVPVLLGKYCQALRALFNGVEAHCAAQSLASRKPRVTILGHSCDACVAPV